MKRESIVKIRGLFVIGKVEERCPCCGSPITKEYIIPTHYGAAYVFTECEVCGETSDKEEWLRIPICPMVQPNYENIWNQLKAVLKRSQEVNSKYDKPYHAGVEYGVRSTLLMMEALEKMLERDESTIPGSN